MRFVYEIPTVYGVALENAETETELRAICPFCQSLTQNGNIDAKFYLNLATGLYYCFHCLEKGKDLPEYTLEGLVIVDEITKRQFDPSSLAKIQWQHLELSRFETERLNGASGVLVGYSPEQQAIAIPVKDFMGEVVGIKYRKLDPAAKPRYLSETGSVNEGYWLRGTDDTKLLILEGELDAITAVISGFKGSVLATQTNRLNPSQLKTIKTFKNVFVLPDNDLGGTELENSCNELLGPLKATFVRLHQENCKDLNELLQRRGYDECSKFIQLETRTELERDTRSLSQSIPELLTWLSDERHSRGDTTGWKSIDALLGGGLRSGEMSIINAFAKAGKSSFINNLIHNLAKSDKKVALASFEMPPQAIYTSLISIALDVNIRNLSNEDRTDLIQGSTEVYNYLDNITMLQRFGYTPWEEIEEWAKLMKSLHNIDYLVLDHAGFMVEKMTDAEENQVLAKNIKKLTNTLGIHIPVVVQAPKTKDGLSIQTSYGGMAWAMNADNFITLERSKDNDTELRVKLEAARYPGANPSSTPALLFYQRESCALIE